MTPFFEKFTRRLGLLIEVLIVSVLLLGAAGIWAYQANRLQKNQGEIAALFESQTRTAQGTAYWRDGTGTAALVFVPGMFASKDLFARARPYLRQAFAIYAMDLAGFGYTGAEVAPPTLSGWVGQLDAFLKEMGISRPVLVGQGEGADVVQAFAIRFPNRVQSLVLLGRPPSVATPSPSPGVGRTFLASRLSPLIMPPLSGRLLVRRMLEKMVSHPERLSREEVERFAYPLNRPRFWQQASEAIKGYQPATETPRVSMDVIYGINDSWTPVEPAKKACDSLPDCRFHFLMDAGHLPSFEQPLAFSRLMADLFLP